VVSLAVAGWSAFNSWRSRRVATRALLISESQEQRRRPQLGIYRADGYRRYLPTRQLSERIAPAKGLSHGGKITLLSGMQPAAEFSTLVHEIAHEMLNRGDRRTLTTKQVRETEAEAVAFVVCQSVGRW
jgi:hypothetical protein